MSGLRGAIHAAREVRLGPRRPRAQGAPTTGRALRTDPRRTASGSRDDPRRRVGGDRFPIQRRYSKSLANR